MITLPDEQLEALRKKVDILAATSSHTYMYEQLHEVAGDDVEAMLKPLGIDLWTLEDDQRESLLLAYKDRFWDITGKEQAAERIEAALNKLLDWCRSNISHPTRCGIHELLVEAHEALGRKP